MANNALVDIIRKGDKDALNAYLSQQTIGGDAGGLSLDGTPNNALTALVRGQSQPQVQPQVQPPIQSSGMQPLNTIRTSSGQYLTPGGERSGTPIEFSSQAQPPQFRGTPVDVMGQGKGYMQPDGSIVGINAAGQRFSVNPAGTAAASQAQQDAALNRQMKQAQIADTMAQIQQRQMAGTGQKPVFNADAGGYVYAPSAEDPQGKFVPVAGLPGGKGAPSQAQRIQDATDAMNILQQAAPLIDKSTHSGVGTAYDYAAGLVGMSPEGAKAADQLKVLGGALVSKMPKMSGPQSDKDVLLYKEMAGRIGDPMIPAERKKAAMQTIMELQSKYAGSQPLPLNFSGEGQQNGMITPHPQDTVAMQWAKANPSDPRAARILQLAGG